jgi:uncharacterized membrane protein
MDTFQNEHRFNNWRNIDSNLKSVGVDTSKMDETDYSTLSRLAREYKRAAIAGAAIGAVAGTPLLGIGAIPGAIIGAIAGVGARINLSGVDVAEYTIDKSISSIERD